MPALPLPLVTIEYCTGCRWLLRAAWLAQEFLSTFESDLGGVTLRPGTGGVFRVWVTTTGGEELLWCRKRDGGFPQPADVKTRLRDLIAPGRDLGHVDRKPSGETPPSAD